MSAPTIMVLIGLWMILLWCARAMLVMNVRLAAVRLIAAHLRSQLFTSSIRGRRLPVLMNFDDLKDDVFGQIIDLRRWTLRQFYPNLVTADVRAKLCGYEPWVEEEWRAYIGRLK